jgi:hypothetical protein
MGLRKMHSIIIIPRKDRQETAYPVPSARWNKKTENWDYKDYRLGDISGKAHTNSRTVD